MRVLVAGATGVIGRQLVPQLRAAGHEPIALARSRGDVTADALDRDALVAAVAEARPDAVAHLLTAIPAAVNPRRIARDFALTNRLREEGTRNLLEAARATGARRFVAQSIAFAYGVDGPPAVESDPLWPDRPDSFAPVLDAVASLERQTLAADGVVLRLGHLYGPGTGYADDGMFPAMLRKRRLPIVGDGGAAFSFLHTEDAAAAFVAALALPERADTLNVVEDEPQLARDWIPRFAETLGAKPPRRVPAWLARPMVGGYGVAFMTGLRAASNAKAREALGWAPAHRFPEV